MRSLRLTGSAALALTAALTLAGCGSDSSEPSAETASSTTSATEAAAAAPTTGTLAVPPAEPTLPAAAPQEYRQAASPMDKLRTAFRVTASAQTARFTLTAGSSGSATGQRSLTTHETTMEAQQPSAGTVSAYLRGNETAVRFASSPLPVIAAGQWYRIDPATALGRQVQSVIGLLRDPIAAAVLVSPSLRSVDEVGTETVGGVSTTHYRASVDTEAYINDVIASTGLTGADADQARERARQSVSDQWEYWVDADGLVRQSVNGETRGTLSDYGAPFVGPGVDPASLPALPGF